MATLTLVFLWWLVCIAMLRNAYFQLRKTHTFVLFPVVFIGGAMLIMVSLLIWGTLWELGIQ